MKQKFKNLYTKKIIMAAILTAMPTIAWAAPSISSPQAPVEKNSTAAAVENTAPAAKLPAGTTHFKLQKIVVDPSGLQINLPQLQEELQSFQGRDIDTTGLAVITARITAWCRTHGYPAAGAYLPSQTASEGTLTVRLLPGKYGKILVDNQSALRTESAQRLLRGLKTGAIIRSRSLETALYNISDLGGVEAAGILSPGAEVGTSDITVRVRDGRRSSYVLYSENYGSTSSGRYRYGLQANLTDLSGVGDTLNLSTLLSNHDLRNYSLNYEYPLGSRGTKLNLGISRMDYTLAGALQARGANGKADTLSLSARTPLWHTGKSSLAVSCGYDYRKLTDDLDAFGFDSQKHSHALHLGLDGTQRGTDSLLNYGLTLYTGTIGMDSADARTLDDSSHTAGRYSKAVLDLKYQQALDTRWDILMKFSGQKASRNLDSSEEIYLGGANAVRAYPQGEGSGDEGWQGTAELRYHTGCPGLVLSTYLDSGHVKLSRDGENGGETLQGWGLGVSYNQSNWFARFDYARRIGLSENASEEAKSPQRLWFMLGRLW